MKFQKLTLCFLILLGVFNLSNTASAEASDENVCSMLADVANPDAIFKELAKKRKLDCDLYGNSPEFDFSKTTTITTTATADDTLPLHYEEDIASEPINEQIYEFIPGFDAWSDGVREGSDFWLTHGGQRIYVPMHSRNWSILTDLRRDREMYG